MVEVFNQITKEIKEHDTIFIMGHQEIDFDALGSALCLYEIVSKFEKDCYLFLDRPITSMDQSIQNAFEKLKPLSIQLLFGHNYKKKIGNNPLIIVVDTHKYERVAYPKLLEQIKDVIVIDHHIKGNGYIKDTIMSYMNSSLSSVVEFMVHYAKYLNVELPPIISSIMLAGISVDTNEYRMKTTDATFEASSLLMKMGADNIQKLEFMRETKEDYLKRLDFVKKSDIVKDGFALCMMDEQIVQAKDLAIISESLLQFKKINAAFTIGRLDDDIVGISARSLGDINVEEMMEALGGGGHYHEAACQLKGISLIEAKHKIMNIIR